MSVYLSRLSTAAAACGRFAAVSPAGKRYRSIAAAGDGAKQHGGQQQVRAVSRYQVT